MKPHTWTLEEGDAGHIGTYTYRTCHACGACGGDDIMPMPPFVADGSGFQVSEDCDEAKLQIEKHRATWVPPRQREPRPVGGASVGPVTREAPDPDPEDSKLGYELWGYKYDHLNPERMADFSAYCGGLARKQSE